MGIVFSVPKPVPPKPRVVIPPGPAGLHMLSGVELSCGRQLTAERLANLAERLREHFVSEAAQ